MIKQIFVDGLWVKNPALVQLLGLCPLLAVTGSVVNALGLGLATLVVIVGSNIAVSLIRSYVPDTIRLPAFVMIIASLVTCAELLMQAYAFELYQIISLFVSLIVTNCAILGRAEGFARKNTVWLSALDGLFMGIGFLFVLVFLGAMREVLGHGTLFDGMELLLGPAAADLKIVVFEDYTSFIFAILPPGAFIGLGLIIAFKNLVDNQIEERKKRFATKVVAGAKRVRVTNA
ncbi:MAG: electron transport complex subunit E [Saccharospirillaceae bacterium]|nr:electron transport complex subunit E [Pseudomonadales bacterium]NRB79981.1 electron transport complex subunit E [Saccharospirillaceae bacterium]